MKKLEDLFLHMLKDVYHAEKQLLRAMPKMAKSTESEELRQAFETHREETVGQIERLEQVFELMGKRLRGDAGPVRGRQGGHGGGRGSGRHGCRRARRRPGDRALRDRALRHAQGVG